MESFIVDISRWFKNTWCKWRISCDTMVVKHSKATINHPYFDGLSVYPTISHLFVVQLKMVCYCFTNIAVIIEQIPHIIPPEKVGILYGNGGD